MKVGMSLDAHVRKHGEIFTPEWIVNDACDLLKAEMKGAFSDIEVTFLDPACCKGELLTKVFEKKLKECKYFTEGVKALKSIYGIDSVPSNVAETKKQLAQLFVKWFDREPDFLFEAFVEGTLDDNIVCGDFETKKMDNGAPIWFWREAEHAKEVINAYRTW